MISALKRLTKKQDEPKPVFPAGVAAMGQAMQRKFARGIQYNSKYNYSIGQTPIVFDITGLLGHLLDGILIQTKI